MIKFFLLSAFNQLSIAAVSPYMQIIFRNKGYSYSLTGIIMAIGQSASIIIPLLVSFLVGKKGRTKPFMIGIFLLSILCFIPAILLDNIFFVIIFTFLANGFFWCNNPLTDGYISREIGGNSSSYGNIRAIGTLSYVIALVLFGLFKFPNESNNKSILLCICLSLLPVLITSSILPETKRNANNKDKKKRGFSFSWFKKSFYIYMGIVFLTRIAEGVVDKLLSSYMVEELHLSSYFSLFVAIGAFFEFICMLLFGRLLNKKKVTPYFTLLLSSLALTLRMLLYLLPGIVPFTIAQTLHGLTFGALHVGTISFINNTVENEHYEMASTIYWSLAVNLPELIATLFGGFIIDNFGYPRLFLIYSIFPFVGALLALFFKGVLKERKI